MGIMAHDVAIFKSAGLTFIGIHAEIFRLINLGDKAPFDSSRKAGSAPAPQTSFLYLLDNLFGLKIQRLTNGFITSLFKIDINIMEMGKIKITTQNFLVHSLNPI
jgi:hypothetical protein